MHQLKLEKGASGFMLQFTSDFYDPSKSSASVVLRKVSNKIHCHLSIGRFERIAVLLQNIFHEFSEKQEHENQRVSKLIAISFLFNNKF